ncbi:MAG: dihydroneopterin triphosphate diphosphatase [Gammaproteobacteria bacterium]|nr:dihydroneopterin triphosphate diphosphatase [Gammaproteobacteria bacterium]MDH3467201.1 dihydroneopterin triphosphate diphosphatase [Gammaproteobacteria bacterium]
MEPASLYKRPESVLVVVHTVGGDVLLLHRVEPSSFWQSVTGSLRWEEADPAAAARREVREETGIHDVGVWHDWQRTMLFDIPSAWGSRYAPGVTRNLEHMFSLALSEICSVTINPAEHSNYEWVDFDTALQHAWSWTNREALQLVRKRLT